MQGQRGTIGSFPEILNFDHGSTSSGAAIDQQICWNNMHNPAENQLSDYMLSSCDTNGSYVNSIGHEQYNVSGWSLGEPSSSNPPSNIISVDNPNVNPLLIPRSTLGSVPQNPNLSAGFVDHGRDDFQVMERCNLLKSKGTENELIPPPSSSQPFLITSRSDGYLVEENDSRPGCSLDVRRASCKRKAVEENIGQSSVSGNSSYFRQAESSAWSAVRPRYNVGGSLSISAPTLQLNPRLGLGARGLASDMLPDLSVTRNAENSHRNIRVRLNPSIQQDSTPARLPSVSSSGQPSILLSIGQSMNYRDAPVADDTTPQNHSTVVHVPALQQNVQSFRWAGSSSSRAGGSSNAVTPGDDVFHESARSRSATRNNLEHPLYMPAPVLRNLARNPTTNSSSGGHINIPTDVTSGSTSRSGSIAVVRSSTAPTLIPHRNPPSRNPRRLSEYVRRTLFASPGTEPGDGQSSNYPPLQSIPPAAMQHMERSSRAGNQGQRHHQSNTRLASWMERQGDGIPGFPYYMRNLATSGEGRRRLVSEIRNALDLMRRGDALRLEDVMILDQTVLFGVADIHDRHRDMRLDVDNMSYEELLALEERIGNVCTGLSEESILNHLKQRKYCTPVGDQTETEPCCVCQEEYNEGEALGTLECGHDFHTNCIKQWLTQKNSCPVCKTTGLTT